MSVLELEDIEKYDVVTAIQVHHYLSEKDRRLVVEKCCRALKAGGLFFTFENIANTKGTSTLSDETMRKLNVVEHLKEME